MHKLVELNQAIADFNNRVISCDKDIQRVVDKLYHSEELFAYVKARIELEQVEYALYQQRRLAEV